MISEFRGPTRWLSNFHECQIEFEGMLFPSVEHAYMAAKTLDPHVRRTIAALPTPKEAKAAGRTVVLRPDWEHIKLKVMFALVYQKFTDHLSLRDKLLATGDEDLVEGNNWGDTFWGQVDGVGENHLGQILMTVRALVRENQQGASP